MLLAAVCFAIFDPVPKLETLPIDALAISGDGAVVVGAVRTNDGSIAGANGLPATWTSAGGAHKLNLTGYDFGVATSCSSDGSIIVGRVGRSRDGAHPYAVIWKGDGPPILVSPIGMSNPAISADGMTVVGALAGNPQRPFKWTETGGIVMLPPLKTQKPKGAAVAITGDGKTIVGLSDAGIKPGDERIVKHIPGLNGDNDEAVLWNLSGGPQGLGRPSGYYLTEATGIASNGSLVVGDAITDDGIRAITWTKQGGLKQLPLVSGTIAGGANGISADGKLIFGGSVAHYAGTDFAWPSVWVGNKALRLVEYFLTKHVAGISSIRLDSINCVSGNGRVLAGMATDAHNKPFNWIVDLGH